MEMMAKDRKGKTGVGITFEELRRAKYDFALGDDARICKHLNDLMRLLRAHHLPGSGETAETDETDKTAGKGRDTRQDRLKSALRENLKRRKVQARERAITDTAQDEVSAPHEGTAGKTRD